MVRDGFRLLVALLVVVAGVGAVGTAGAAQPAAPGDTAAVAEPAAATNDAIAQENCSFPVTVEDAKGNEITLDERPDSVVALQPSAAQTMWEIGGQGQVTGMAVSRYTEYLDGRDNVTDISQDDGVSVNVETVVATEADLVLAPNSTPDETISQVRNAGMTVYEFREAGSLDDIYEKTNRTGRLTGNCEGAAETVDRMQTEIRVVNEAISGEDAAPLYYQMGGGYTPGEGTFINHIIELGGGENIAVAAGVEGYGQLSGEVIIEQNPEWIMVSRQMGLQESEALSGTTAVQEDQVIEVNANYLTQPGPRVVVPISQIAESIHPEAYEEANVSVRGEAEINGSNSSGETTTTVENGGETDSDGDGESDSDGQPGMGAGAAVAALVAALALAGRR
ncbi:PGF-CTERM-anchored ABC transporter substrate-binding protein [Halostella pelagica]|uniref:PGF-CTERM-anchored ABC transporter substrate-binding protein n=1 Tax=Halostella pelagica TaxID=2583824 RepID=UPI0010814AF8|nr:PGF-CTERM-anchored ABC transporter substrate-binding protein [Halostella pelagica]